jgi:hypothetical protein
MPDKDAANPVAAALSYLRARNQFFEFDSQERVVEVSISGTSNTDDLAAHIGNLHDLRKLTFWRTDLTDSGLSNLAPLVRLRKLSFENSSITAHGLIAVCSMSKLRYLHIDNARELGRAAFDYIAQATSLRELSLHGSGFCDRDLEPLAALVNLGELSLSKNHEIHGTFCKYLIGLPRLRQLSICETGGRATDDGLACIAGLTGLRSLFVTGPFTNAGLQHLVALQELNTLSIHSDEVTAEALVVLAKMPKLNSLYLEAPRVTDDGIPALLRCSALESMHLYRSAISDTGLQRLRDCLPRCDVRDVERDRREDEPADDHNAWQSEFDSNAPFETLLAKANDWDLVEATSDKLVKHYRYWLHVGKYSPVERVIFLVYQSGSWIDGGGFDYLFTQEFEGDPDFSFTADAYRIAGIDRSYEAFQAAIRLFPGGVVPRDAQERSRLYEAANKSAREGANRKFWHDDRARKRKLAEFIRANAAELGHLDTTWRDLK